jgi:hypothetical protein
MALDHGYAVLTGTLTGYHRDTPDDQGRWYHVHLDVDADGVAFEVAVDVDSKQSATGVRWKTVAATAGELGPALTMGTGQHALPSTSTSGALDHLRHPVMRRWRLRRTTVRIGPLRIPFFVLVSQSWHTGSHLDASQALEAILTVGAQVIVWGEPFTQGNGAHNVHQNQGDPVGSQWWAENGIWQDGAVATARPGGGFRLFAPAFSSQAQRTDGQGHPA